jgi:molybdenum cofactor cytidylyltransferase
MPAPVPVISFGVALLAAGASTRMGRPKLLLPWGGSSVIEHLIGQWRSVGATQIAVVCAAKDQPMQAELDRLGFSATHRIVNAHPERGMFSSIQCAARWPGWEDGLSHWILSLGDQPHVQDETLAVLIQFGARHPETVCQPARHGRARHPVLLPAPAFQRLAAWTGDNLKQFLQSEPRTLCEMEDPALDFDLDEPADYERAVALCFGKQ